MERQTETSSSTATDNELYQLNLTKVELMVLQAAVQMIGDATAERLERELPTIGTEEGEKNVMIGVQVLEVCTKLRTKISELSGDI